MFWEPEWGDHAGSTRRAGGVIARSHRRNQTHTFDSRDAVQENGITHTSKGRTQHRPKSSFSTNKSGRPYNSTNFRMTWNRQWWMFCTPTWALQPSKCRAENPTTRDACMYRYVGNFDRRYLRSPQGFSASVLVHYSLHGLLGRKHTCSRTVRDVDCTHHNPLKGVAKPNDGKLL